MRITLTHILTALTAALIAILSLKFLQVFHFIKWSPIGWSERYHLFTDGSVWFKWSLLLFFCFLLFFLLYMIGLFTSAIPPSLTSIVLAVAALLLIEWLIYASPGLTAAQFLKKVSIPFGALLAMIVRFVVGTSVYIRKTF